MDTRAVPQGVVSRSRFALVSTWVAALMSQATYGCFNPEDNVTATLGTSGTGTSSAATVTGSGLTSNGQTTTAASTTAGTFHDTDTTGMATSGQTSGNDTDAACAGDRECDDHNDCTRDSCDGHTCAHEPLVDDPACFCEGPGDCRQLPADNACHTRTCIDHVCGLDFAPENTPVGDPQQSPGDCRLIVCDGQGDIVSVIDDEDVPVDGLECTADVCEQGTPSNPPLDQGTPCAAGVCDAAGACTGCISPADCGGEDTFCQHVTCELGTCGVDNTASGTPLPTQVAGDCRTVQCNGTGEAVQAVDDRDVPEDDGNACTADVCSDGDVGHPELPAGTECDQDGGVVCDGAGACVACNSAAQCPSPGGCMVAACVDHACTVVPAGLGTSCDDGLFCTGNDQCNANGSCVGGADPCPGADGDSDCSETCDEAANACTGNDAAGTACTDGEFCTATDTCNGSGACVGSGNPCPGADGDSDCSESCDEAANACTGNDPTGSSCNDGLYCTATDTCNASGSCVGTGNPCPGADGDSDCSETCNESADACTGNDPGGSSCSDGLFCTSTDTCNGSGTCVGAGNPCPGADGDSDCSEMCNESTDSCTGNDPSGSACSDGLFCTATDRCNGSGTCVGTGTPCPGADGDSDCTETCNEATDACTAPDPDGSDCGACRYCSAGSCSFECVTGERCCPGAPEDICLPTSFSCP